MAEAEELGVITYSPLGGGLLTGKYAGEQKPEVGRLLSNKAYQARYGDDWMRETAARFSAFARERGLRPGRAGRRLGRRSPGGHRADHRRAQPDSSWKAR